MLLLLHHPFLFKENQRKLKTQQEGFLAPLLGRSSLKSRHTKYPSQTHLPRIYIIAICLSFFSPPLHHCRFICPLFPNLSLFRLPFSICLCVGLLIAMAQDNTKLCDFSNTNNNDFLSTPISPLNDVTTKKLHFRDDTCLSQQVAFFVMHVHP